MSMAEYVDRAEAEKVLLLAFRKRCTKDDETSRGIKRILAGRHKTYRYILVNGLLAKAVNDNINILALQAGAPIQGAYDARSLCHHVLVPFERDFLYSALGGSNEPFLNKPARFTHLDKSNAVRRGEDKETLVLLIDVLNAVATSAEAVEYLSCALGFLSQKIGELRELQDRKIKYSPTLVEIYEFIFRFLEESSEGEAAVIIVGTAEKIYHRRFTANFKVVVHKVNQSGASSNEVGDVDIYKKGVFSYAIEVKDKNFSPYDLEHAFQKIRACGGKKGQFIYGPNARFDQDLIDKKITEFEQAGFMVLFQDIYTYAKTMIFKADLSSKQEFIGTIFETAADINCREDITRRIQHLLVELNWK
jgi:hypothetical protein